MSIVLTGVSGSGKSEVGRAVAKGLGLKFLDAAAFHSNANKDGFSQMTNASDIGLVGLAVMGEDLVLNMESKGFSVSVYNRKANSALGPFCGFTQINPILPSDSNS